MRSVLNRTHFVQPKVKEKEHDLPFGHAHRSFIYLQSFRRLASLIHSFPSNILVVITPAIVTMANRFTALTLVAMSNKAVTQTITGKMKGLLILLSSLSHHGSS